MNLILFDSSEIADSTGIITITAADQRARHLAEILRAGTGSVFDAGIINGEIGKAEIIENGPAFLGIRFSPQGQSAEPHPLTLILGLSRPPTVKKVLKEATALGVARFILCGTDSGERSYRQSSSLNPDKIREVLLEGAQQAVSTILPEVSIEHSLRCALEKLDEENTEMHRLALDNYEAEEPLSEYWKNRPGNTPTNTQRKTMLAVGSERGWTDRERSRFRDAGFRLLSLGPRVLRTETASIAGLAVCLSGMGLI